MSIVYPKNKEKRSRSSSSEVNSSFVKNMTSRVSGLLPATISKWFSSPSSVNVNGSATTAADATDSSTEDEDVPEGPILVQPPLKRMRFSSPGKYNHYNPIEGNSSSNNVTLDPCNSYDTLPSLSGRTSFRRKTNFVSTPIMSSAEEASVEKNDNKDVNSMKHTHTMSSTGASVSLKRRSLFDSFCNDSATRAHVKTSSTMNDTNQPCFKPSLLGSPFYSGRTMYGGSSSSYINQPNIKQTRNMQVNETNSNENNTISHSARRIMDLLEDYSSPLSEAKRIPQFSRKVQKKSPSSSDSSITSGDKTISYKTQELHVPSIVSILRLKRRSRLMDTTTAARQIIASHSSTSDYPPITTSNVERDQTENESAMRYTSKVKTKLTRTKRGDDFETQLPVAVNLPSATLQINENNLPKFSYIPLTTDTTSFSKTRNNFSVTENKTEIIEAKTTTKTTTETQVITTTNSTFKFSSPVKLPFEAATETTTPPKFTFGSPKQSIDADINKNKTDPIQSCTDNTVNNHQSSDKSVEKDWKCDSCWVFNKPESDKCVCCESPKSTKISDNKVTKCSICRIVDVEVAKDTCVNCNLKKVDTFIPFAKPTQVTTWRCQDCWVDNEQNAENCVCCGGKKPSSNKLKSEEDSVVPYNTTESEWKCNDCWVKNNNLVDKCVACGGDRKNTKNKESDTIIPDSKTPNSLIQDIVKKQSNKWECSNCLVRNDNDRIKCVCCETERVGAVKESEKKTFNFGINTSFKFGIDPKLNEKSEVAESKSSSDATPQVKESETNNNTISQIPTFTFSLPAKKSEDQIPLDKKSEEKVNNVAKTNFTFGIPKIVTTIDNIELTTTSTSFTVPSIFSAENKVESQKIVHEEKEKPQEVPKVDLPESPKSQEAPKFSNMFSTTFIPQTTQEKPVSPFMNTCLPTEKKDLPSNPLNVPTITLTASGIEPLQTKSPTFSTNTNFSMPAKPTSQNIFGSTATTAMPFVAPSQNVTATSAKSMFEKAEPVTATANIAIFQKNDNSSLSTSLFQKPEATSTALPAPTLGATAPIFSFGSNTQPVATQAEKPKFNFTFGTNNKTETPSLFKNAFGGTNDSTSNKFSMNTEVGATGLGSGSMITSGPSLTNNILGGNAFTANSMVSGGNEMSNNTIQSGNILQTSVQNSPSAIFGAPIQKENMWSSSNNTSSNLFASNVSSNNIQKPTTFTFGSSTSFNAPTAASPFGSPAQPTSNLFGIPNQPPNNLGNVFSSPGQNQNTTSLFGSPQQPTNAAPTAIGIFGTPNVGATPTFGTPNASIPPFEAPSLTPAPAPTFNFGAPQTSGVFGFGQGQGQTAGQQASGMYTFGGAGGAGAAPPLQFSMGSAPNMAARRVRKAVRRNNLR